MLTWTVSGTRNITLAVFKASNLASEEQNKKIFTEYPYILHFELCTINPVKNKTDEKKQKDNFILKRKGKEPMQRRIRHVLLLFIALICGITAHLSDFCLCLKQTD